MNTGIYAVQPRPLSGKDISQSAMHSIKLVLAEKPTAHAGLIGHDGKAEAECL